MKRKAESQAAGQKQPNKKSKSSLSDEEAKKRFRKGLFDKKVLGQYTKGYAGSSPYKHSVIHNLVDDKLLRSVRDEIKDNVSFTPKETDIYKIHQSGDLANLDGLDDDALAKLPSLLALRDAMYSPSFRDYVSRITGCGSLSGRKTDMAINVYTPGCFLLCHDDVIGSRKVSYILYLTDPDTPWKPEWGGALRLFPTREIAGARTTEPDASKVIPPAWNQLSFFAVQPGESFHDVEEVYRRQQAEGDQKEDDGGRVRMAISGWFHIPQVGEDGYVAGAEEKLAKNSGLMQLQGNPDQYDAPRAQPVPVPADERKPPSQAEFDDEDDLEFLLRYMAPTYLTPDTLEQISEHFEDGSSITLPNLLGKRFAKRVRDYVVAQEQDAAAALPGSSAEIEERGPWRVARPPHKHRFLYQQSTPSDAKKKNGKSNANAHGDGSSDKSSPIRELLDDFFPSPQFRRWLQMATGCTVESHDLVARRFRRGLDYTLATGHEGKPRLELNLGITPTTGWGDEGEEEDEGEAEEEEETSTKTKTNGKGKGKKGKKSAAEENSDKSSSKGRKGKDKGKGKGKGKGKDKAKQEEEEDEEEEEEEQIDVGGQEVYMAGDDDATDDAAIYKSGGDGDEGDNILFFQSAAWNKLTIVLRDSGALRFVKYVSRSARGDRWDVSGTFEVEEQDDDDDDDDDDEEDEDNANGVTANGNGGDANANLLEGDTEEEWNGFSSSSDGESD